jgi:hypothetical protein
VGQLRGLRWRFTWLLTSRQGIEPNRAVVFQEKPMNKSCSPKSATAVMAIPANRAVAGLVLEPATEKFVDSLAGAKPVYTLTISGGPRVAIRSGRAPPGFDRGAHDLLAWKWNYGERRGPGRPRTLQTIVELIVSMAVENAS